MTPDGDQKLRALTQLAQYSLLEGDIKRANAYLEEGQALADIAKDPPMKALYHYGKAFYSIFAMNYENGLKELEMALDLMKRGPLCPSMTFTSELLKAEILLKMGRLQEAYAHANDSLKKAQFYFQDTKNMFCAKAMMIMAASQPAPQQGGKKSLELLKSASTIFEGLAKDAKGKHRRQAWSLMLMGDVYLSQEAWKEAFESYKQAEAIYDRLYKSKELDDYSLLYSKLTFLGAKTNDDEVTRHYLKKHIDTFGLDHPRTKELFKHLDEQSLQLL